MRREIDLTQWRHRAGFTDAEWAAAPLTRRLGLQIETRLIAVTDYVSPGDHLHRMPVSLSATGRDRRGA